MGSSSTESAVTVAIAEFNALRDEIISHTTAQTTVVGLGVTALGIVVGFVAKEGADDGLLLVVPALSMFVILLHTAANYRMRMLGDYICTELWPFLENRVGALPSWEKKASEFRSSQGLFLKAIVFDSPAVILFLAASTASLVWVRDYGDTLWQVGCLMTVVAFAVPIVVARSGDPSARPSKQAAGHSAPHNR